MTAKYFLDSVILMRKAQKEYFKTRSMNWLAESKRLEKIVDTIITNYQNARSEIEPTQLDMFQ